MRGGAGWGWAAATPTPSKPTQTIASARRVISFSSASVHYIFVNRHRTRIIRPLPERGRSGALSMNAGGPESIAETLLRQLPLSPDAYPQSVDFARESALVVLLDANRYRAASFLDDRILGPGMTGAWLPFGRVVEASLQVRNARPLHFVFHTGHVGSTL